GIRDRTVTGVQTCALPIYMAIGISAPWIVLSLIRNPLFAASRRFVIWNILGIADFVVAVSMAALSSGAFPGINGLIGNVTTSPKIGRASCRERGGDCEAE